MYKLLQEIALTYDSTDLAGVLLNKTFLTSTTVKFWFVANAYFPERNLEIILYT